MTAHLVGACAARIATASTAVRSAGGESDYLETSSAATSFTYTGACEKSGTPPTAGTKWTVKNLFELKNAQQVTIDGNVIENVWAAGQYGYAIVLTPRNQNGSAPPGSASAT